MAQQITWTPYDASACVEGFDGLDHSEDEILSAWQYLIDTGLAWTLQGWYGRQARALIDEGICLPAEESRLLKAAKALGKIEFVHIGG